MTRDASGSTSISPRAFPRRPPAPVLCSGTRVSGAYSSAVEPLAYNEVVGGSIPSAPTGRWHRRRRRPGWLAGSRPDPERARPDRSRPAETRSPATTDPGGYDDLDRVRADTPSRCPVEPGTKPRDPRSGQRVGGSAGGGGQRLAQPVGVQLRAVARACPARSASSRRAARRRRGRSRARRASGRRCRRASASSPKSASARRPGVPAGCPRTRAGVLWMWLNALTTCESGRWRWSSPAEVPVWSSSSAIWPSRAG